MKLQKAGIYINIVNNDCSGWPQRRPSPIHLKTHISFTMEAIMYEEIDLAELRK